LDINGRELFSAQKTATTFLHASTFSAVVNHSFYPCTKGIFMPPPTPQPPMGIGERAELICGSPPTLVGDVDGGWITVAGILGGKVCEIEAPRWGARRAA
jgi:hypothetical protein